MLKYYNFNLEILQMYCKKTLEEQSPTYVIFSQ